MAIPEKTVNDLIIRAFYLINEYSPEELPNAWEISEGLFYLNEILDNFSGNDCYVPYTNEINFNTVAHQYEYTFGHITGATVDTQKIIDIMDMYLVYGGLRYPITEIGHDIAFQLVRYPEAYARPSQYFLQNENEYSQVTLFNTPDISYPVTVRAKQVLSNLDLQQEIKNVPAFYQRFLRYALARELTSIFETNTWTDLKEKEYIRMLGDIIDVSDTDWSLNISSILMKRPKGDFRARNIIGGY